MAFWALGAFDKVKNITERLNIKDVSKKVISYVVRNTLLRQRKQSIERKWNQLERRVALMKRIWTISPRNQY